MKTPYESHTPEYECYRQNPDSLQEAQYYSTKSEHKAKGNGIFSK